MHLFLYSMSALSAIRKKIILFSVIELKFL
jgi:hypothetical protein